VNIIDYLQQFSGNEILYFPNPGNAGDSLIACATLQVFQKAGLQVRWFDTHCTATAHDILFFGGGGNLINSQSAARKLIKLIHRRVKKLIILPHTIRENEDLLSELGSNVDVITREKISFQHVRKYSRHARVLLTDDLAFNLDPAPLLINSISFFGPLTRAQLSYRSARRLIRSLLWHRWFVRPVRSGVPNDVLNAFRRDAEASAIQIPERNFDISRIFAFGTDNPVVCELAGSMLTQTIDRFSLIRTNRLHVAIAAILLGKRVEFYSNNYYKNEAIYHFSMAGKFDKVQWMG
jgi:exopolysaccharide biosynthesis predicted pyruvyltransferase EpsI